MLFGRFCRKKIFTDAQKSELANAIAGMLEVQNSVAVNFNSSMDDEKGNPKRKALGYVYGYIDAALRTRGYDMADMEIGVPITYQVIRKLWPDRVEKYMDYLIKNLSTDQLMGVG